MNFKHLLATLLTAVTFTAQAADRIIQAPSANGNIVFKNAAGTTTATLSSTGNLTTTGNVVQSSPAMFRNRIINGGMVFDQRKAGANYVGVSNEVTLDRWRIFEGTDGVVDIIQTADAPAGFSKSLKLTVTTADTTLAANQRIKVSQPIEGYNIADFAFGTSSAKSFTLSFWVKSSVTGTFGVGITNGPYNRGYAASYTINSANTWEYKTITISGDVTGTWYSDSRIGIGVIFALGIGSDWTGALNTWSASEVHGPAGAVALISTLNATWQITGVQLEPGTVATPFEFRPYGTELALCKRYFERINYSAYANCGTGHVESSTIIYMSLNWDIEKRTAPTISFNGAFQAHNGSGTPLTITPATLYSSAKNNALFSGTVPATTNGSLMWRAYNTGNSVDISAEL